MQYYGFDWLAMVCGLSGMYLLGSKSKYGFVFFMIGSSSWIDLSPEMVKQSRRLNPEISFRQGNMLDLKKIADDSFGGIAAFYSIIHVSRDSVIDALREMKRVLCPEGLLLLTFHIGQEIRHLDEWFDKKVSLDFFFFETDEMKRYLDTAGFEIEEAIEREPIPDIEVQTRRAYIFARKP